MHVRNACTLNSHLLQFTVGHKSRQTAEGASRSATGEHLWTLQAFKVLGCEHI